MNHILYPLRAVGQPYIFNEERLPLGINYFSSDGGPHQLERKVSDKTDKENMGSRTMSNANHSD